MKALESLAKLCAIAAGVLLVAITLMTCVSLGGRNTTGWTIVGDAIDNGIRAGDTTYDLVSWVVPLILATLIIGIIGVILQQVHVIERIRGGFFVIERRVNVAATGHQHARDSVQAFGPV